jgi:hypothetical protein
MSRTVAGKIWARLAARNRKEIPPLRRSTRSRTNEGKKRRPAPVPPAAGRQNDVWEFVALEFVELALIATFVYLARSLFIFVVRLLASKGARTFASLSK